MNLVTVGLSHHTAPIELREKMAPLNGEVPLLLKRLRDDRLGMEAVLLSTCNRVELYSIIPDGRSAEDLARWLLGQGGVSHRGALQHLYQYSEQDALRHLFRVISSLDSMIIGEPQIVAQLKEAYRVAVDAGSAGPILRRVMDKALQVAKRVRTETDIAREAVSIGRAGVELARQVIGDLKGASALLIGAGSHGKLVARNLFGHGLSEMVIANRTFSRASSLAEQFGAAAIPLGDIGRYLERVDIVLTSTGAARTIISKRDLAPLLRKRRYRPLVLIDLSVPRVIETSVNDLDSVFRFDVDDLAQVAERGKKKRLQAAAAAEEIVSAEAELRWREVIVESYNPLIGSIPRGADRIRRAELARVEKILAQLNPAERRAIDKMTRAIVNKILHKPMTQVRSAVQDGDSRRLGVLMGALMQGEDDDDAKR
ncbi:MAG: glutamyl-tRNA reductase [Myxococcota bacterium]|jgi:glutamyl-tRNA reductase